MTEPFLSRGFRGRRPPGATARRLPPGQYEWRGFPVLWAGPTPFMSLATWDFAVRGPAGSTARWTPSQSRAVSDGGYTTDLPLADVALGNAWGIRGARCVTTVTAEILSCT